MKKLLMVTGLGAAEGLAQGKFNALYGTLQEFHKHWDRIDIIVPRVKNQKVSELFGNVFIHTSPLPLFFHPLYFVYKIIRLHRSNKFDLMTVHEFPPFYNGIGARIISYATGIPYVLEVMHIPGHPKPGSMKEALYKIFFRIFIRFDAGRAAAVRVINHGMRDLLRSRGVPDAKLKLISAMYIDTNIFKPMDVPVEYDLAFVGRLEGNKGISLFLDAVQQSGLRALVVGDGPLKRFVLDYVETHHLSGKVAIHGWARDSAEVAELINRSRILVMPSYNEGGPRVVLEAMACGVPVVATPVGMVPDMIRHGESGMLVDWSSDDIVAKVTELLSNPALYEKYRSNGLTIAAQHERTKAISTYARELQSIA